MSGMGRSSSTRPPGINSVAGVPKEGRHRSGESDKPFSSAKIEMRVGRDVVRPILSDLLLPFFLLIVFEPALVLVLKTPEMALLIHGGSLFTGDS